MSLTNNQPIFSLCHATARPLAWRNAYDAWISRARWPVNIEYILAVDAPCRIENAGLSRQLIVVANDLAPSAVNAWNAAAAVSTGLVLITVADDFFPLPAWDMRLLEVIGNPYKPAVVAVDEGRSDGLLCHSFLTRAYYEKIGGRLFWPEYNGMYADNEFTDLAQRDNVIIDARSKLTFEHKHPAYGTREADEVDRVHQAQEMYELGRAVYERRKAEGFPL